MQKSTNMLTRREHYEIAVKRNLAAELSGDLCLCPRCSSNWVFPDTYAGMMGICVPCYYEALTEAQAAAEREIIARRNYDAQRKRTHRLKQKTKKKTQDEER